MDLTFEGADEIGELRRRLNALHVRVYSTASMGNPSDNSYFWGTLLTAIHEIVVRRGTCRLLEFGAGYTGIAEFLRRHALRGKVVLTLHDVFSANSEWLASQADSVVFGPVPEIRGEFDVIVSSFVLEHMTDPSASLAALWRCLAPGGSIHIVCPRYDFPFYLPPACDHLSFFGWVGLSFAILVRRIRARLMRRPAFLLLNDASAFYLPYSRDRDAVHLVSLHDLELFFANRGAKLRRYRVSWPRALRDLLTPGGLKGWFVERRLLLAVSTSKS